MPDLFDPYRRTVEVALRQALANDDPVLAPLYGMMRYHLGWCDASFAPLEGRAGKRLRPIICLLCCEGLGGDWRRALPYAVAIELVHNFTLIHDDIEDNGDTRHERPTLWAVWGLAQGVNTGDALWCLARAALHGLRAAGHSAETTLAAIALLDQACQALCEGQFLDISFESSPSIALQEYEQMARGKTAALLAAACQGGGLLAGATAAAQQQLAELGLALGLAYQIVDDLLGTWGDASITGKSAATDLVARKKTFPVAYALAWEAERGLADLQQLYSTPPGIAGVEAILCLLERAEAQEYARSQARRHHDTAQCLLQRLSLREPAASALQALIASLLGRDF